MFAGLGRTVIGVRDASISLPRVLPLPDGGFLIRGISPSGGSRATTVFYKIDARGFPDDRFGDGGFTRYISSQIYEPVGWAVQPDGYMVFGVVSHPDFSGPGYEGLKAAPPSFPQVFYPVKAYMTRIQAIPDIVEFHNRITNHYFIAYDGAEAELIDGGSAGPGWERTQQGFRPGGTTPVCRFYNGGSNSHFFTIEPEECEIVKHSQGWFYEGLGFYAARLVNGACPATLLTVNRLFNNRQRFNDSSHRYVVDLSLVPAMVAQGWSLEGPVFCVKP